MLESIARFGPDLFESNPGARFADHAVGNVELRTQLKEVFLTRTHLVLAMEYAAGGDLFRYVSSRRGLPEDEARWFFQQMMIAVDYCHRMVSVQAEEVHLIECGR